MLLYNLRSGGFLLTEKTSIMLRRKTKVLFFLNWDLPPVFISSNKLKESVIMKFPYYVLPITNVLI